LVAHGEFFLAGGGEMGERMRGYDWSSSPLGPHAHWAQPLKTLISVMLAANQPMFIAWGAGRTLLYNDGYAEILGLKHPTALGQPFNQVWSEIWGELEPIMSRCYVGEAIQMDDITLIMHRNGYPEETHFAFSYTPVRDEAGQVGGVFCPCMEITAKVLADRRQAFRLGLEAELRDLSDPREAMVTAAEALGRHLDAAQVGYAQVDADGDATTGGEFHDGRIPSFRAGRYHLNDYGTAMAADMAAGRVVVVHDVREDARTSSSEALVAYAAISLRAFVIVPLVKGGRLTAYLYAAHPEPRRWSDEELALLGDVAERTWSAVGRAEAETALRESEERARVALGASGLIGLFDWRVSEDRFFSDARFAQLFGIDPERAAAGVPIAEFVEAIHLEDRPRVEAEVGRAMDTGDVYEAEYRVVQSDGEARWVVARGRCSLDPEGKPLRFTGTAVDIHARKMAEDRQALLSREVDHRAKNALAVVQAALRLTKAPDLASYIRAIEGRVGALARAQTLLADDRWAGANLQTLIQGELAPFLGASTDEQGAAFTADLDGPPVALPPGVAQPLAMALHELATNAVKHGALSLPAGRISVSWRPARVGPAGAPLLRLRWAEAGGPPVPGPPERRGFGSPVIEGTVQGQLGGSVSFAWEASGLVCDIEIPLARMDTSAPSLQDAD
jgi:PAS domain S-box-containing protein